jgi:hypothetical protein
VGKCCIELKAIAKPPAAAGRQLHDYVTEKNKVVMLQNGVSSALGGSPVIDREVLRGMQHLLYWGLVINFNPSSGDVETFVPPRVSHSEVVSETSARATNSITAETLCAPSTRISDTDLLACRVKDNGIRGMVDSITAGENGNILFQIQFSDGRRVPLSRSELEPILTDIDMNVSTELKNKVSSYPLYPLYPV